MIVAETRLLAKQTLKGLYLCPSHVPPTTSESQQELPHYSAFPYSCAVQCLYSASKLEPAKLIMLMHSTIIFQLQLRAIGEPPLAVW